MQKKDIIIAGVGGQGILSIANVLGLAALNSSLFVKQSEVHGMSQRGGAVQSHLRISEREIFSDLIPQGSADIILSVEPMEALRYMPYLSPDGVLVANSIPFVNITNYPPADDVLATIRALPGYRLIDAPHWAGLSGNLKATNMVMLGAVSHFCGIDIGALHAAIEMVFSGKGAKAVEQNINAFELGRQAAV